MSAYIEIQLGKPFCTVQCRTYMCLCLYEPWQDCRRCALIYCATIGRGVGGHLCVGHSQSPKGGQAVRILVWVNSVHCCFPHIYMTPFTESQCSDCQSLHMNALTLFSNRAARADLAIDRLVQGTFLTFQIYECSMTIGVTLLLCTAGYNRPLPRGYQTSDWCSVHVLYTCAWPMSASRCPKGTVDRQAGACWPVVNI